MFLYLVQHADAKNKADDPLRPLSEKGVKDMIAMTSYLGKLKITVDEILYSTKLRARQTAELIAKKINSPHLLEVGNLDPMDNPDIWAEKINQESRNLMLVGHLPHLEKLASLLLDHDSDNKIVSFQRGCIIKLEKEEGNWSIQWMLIPEIIH